MLAVRPSLTLLASSWFFGKTNVAFIGEPDTVLSHDACNFEGSTAIPASISPRRCRPRWTSIRYRPSIVDRGLRPAVAFLSGVAEPHHHSENA